MAKIRDELMVSQENSFAKMKEEWKKMQKYVIQTEMEKRKNIVEEIDCVEVQLCMQDDINPLETEISTITEKPRQK